MTVVDRAGASSYPALCAGDALALSDSPLESRGRPGEGERAAATSWRTRPERAADTIPIFSGTPRPLGRSDVDIPAKRKHYVIPVDCVSFMLMKDGRVLAEKRKLTKEIDPGVVTLPGGHVENGESIENALYRESLEELGIIPCSINYICTLLHKTQEIQRIHYFAVEAWEGNIENREAESLLWVPIIETKQLDIDVDRIAISEYLRVYVP